MNHPKGIGNGYVLRFGIAHVYVSGDAECVSEVMALTGIGVVT